MNVELSATEFEVCWTQLQLGDIPIVIDVPSLGRTDTERHQLVANTLNGLRGRGLADERGLDPDLAEVLITLARFRWAVEAWLLLGRPVRALAACRGDVGALAVLEGQRMRVAACAPHALLHEAIQLLRPTAGPGQSVTVRAENLDAAAQITGGDMRRLAEELRRRGERYDDAEALATMCAEHERLAQFGVLIRNGPGPQVAGQRVVGLHATPEGWYSQVRRPGYGGTFVTVTPASTSVLLTQLRELLDETRQLAG